MRVIILAMIEALRPFEELAAKLTAIAYPKGDSIADLTANAMGDTQRGRKQVEAMHCKLPSADEMALSARGLGEIEGPATKVFQIMRLIHVFADFLKLKINNKDLPFVQNEAELALKVLYDTLGRIFKGPVEGGLPG